MEAAAAAVRGAGLEDAHGVARRDLLADRDRGTYGLVGDPQIAGEGQVDHEHPAPRDRSGEGHPARRGGPHRGAGSGPQVNAAVPGTPTGQRRVEAAFHHWAAQAGRGRGHGPGPSAVAVHRVRRPGGAREKGQKYRRERVQREV